MPKCVLFDIDNTLLLKTPSIPQKIYQLAAGFHPSLRPETVEEAYAATELWQGEQIRKENESGVRMPDDEYFENIVAVYERYFSLKNADRDELFAIVSGQYEKTYQLRGGTVQLLEALRAGGVKLGIVSNNSPKIRDTLAQFGLDKLFDCVVISEEVGVYKPDPEILHIADRQLDVSPADCVYVGDHPFDVLCAHDAGMAAVWIPANRYFSLPDYIAPPEHTVHDFSELAVVLLR